jgi:hypothetical protein
VQEQADDNRERQALNLTPRPNTVGIFRNRHEVYGVTVIVGPGTAAEWELKEIPINFEGSKGGRQQGTSYMMSLNVADHA